MDENLQPQVGPVEGSADRYGRCARCIQAVARSVERFELPTDPEFQSRFMLALNFPHMSDRFEHIAHLLPHHAPDPLAEKLRRK